MKKAYPEAAVGLNNPEFVALNTMINAVYRFRNSGGKLPPLPSVGGTSAADTSPTQVTDGTSATSVEPAVPVSVDTPAVVGAEPKTVCVRTVPLIFISFKPRILYSSQVSPKRAVKSKATIGDDTDKVHIFFLYALSYFYFFSSLTRTNQTRYYPCYSP